MRVFLDTNVLLDVIVERDNKQFSDDAATILSLGDKGAIELYMSVLSIPTIAYVIRKIDAERKKQIIKDLTSIVKVLPSNPEHVECMIGGPMNDIEDALQVQSAKEGSCELILTRNINDFKESEIPTLTPGEFLSRILE